MQEAEIIKLASQNRVLVCPAGGDVIVLEKFPYTDLIDPDSLVRVNMVDHVPAWTIAAQKQYTNEPQQKEVEGSYTPKSKQSEPETAPVETDEQESASQPKQQASARDSRPTRQQTPTKEAVPQQDDDDFEEIDEDIHVPADSNASSESSFNVNNF